jgi:hypothetical protein
MVKTKMDDHFVLLQLLENQSVFQIPFEIWTSIQMVSPFINQGIWLKSSNFYFALLAE